MATPDFIRQTDQPLFPEIFWNRPTMRSRGGRLLIIGGQRHEFSQVQAVYQLVEAAGIGEAKAVLPDSLRRLVGEAGFAQFAPASPAGSLGRAALGQILEASRGSDAVVIGANLTSNAETAVMVESLLTELESGIVITDEAISIMQFNPTLITGNPKVLVIATAAGMFNLANHHRMPIAIKPNAGVVAKIEILAQLVSISRCSYVVFGQEILVAAGGEISLTPLTAAISDWPAAVTGTAATFWLQHREKPFAALTTAAFVLAQSVPAAGYNALAASISRTLRQHDR